MVHAFHGLSKECDGFIKAFRWLLLTKLASGAAFLCTSAAALTPAFGQIAIVVSTAESQHAINLTGLPGEPVTQLAAQIQGLYGQKAFIATEYAYDTKTCTLSLDGVWSAPTPPKYGSVSSALVMAPIENNGNPGNCNGTMILQNYVYNTFATGNPSVAVDTFLVSWTTSQGNDPIFQYTVTANRGPRMFAEINQQYVDVTGKTNTFAIGQYVGAGADAYDYLAPNTSISSSSYTAAGSKVQSYTPSSTACNSSVPCPEVIPNTFSQPMAYAYTTPGSYSESWSYTTPTVHQALFLRALMPLDPQTRISKQRPALQCS